MLPVFLKSTHLVVISFIVGLMYMASTSEVAATKRPFWNDTLQINLLNRQAQQALQEKNLKRARNYAQAALKLSEEAFYKRGKAQSYLILAKIQVQNKTYNEAQDYFLQAINGFVSLRAQDALEEAYYGLGNVYLEEDLYKKAQEYFEKALVINQALQHPISAFNTRLRLNTCYLNTQQHTKAIENSEALVKENPYVKDTQVQTTLFSTLAHAYYLDEQYNEAIKTRVYALKLLQDQQDTTAQVSVLNNIGYLYRQLGNEQKAYEYFKKAYRLGSTSQPIDPVVLTNLGTMSAKRGEYQTAQKYLQEAFAAYKRKGDVQAQIRAKNYLAVNAVTFEAYGEARRYATEAANEAKAGSYPQDLSDCYKILAEVYESTNNFKESQQFYQSYLNLRDSLARQERISEQNKFRNELNVEKAEKQFQLLMADAENKEILLKQLQLEDEKKAQALALQAQNQELLRTEIRNEQLEKEQVNQLLAISERKASEERLKQQNVLLEREKALQQSDIEKRKLRETKQQQAISLLAKEKALEQQKTAKQKSIRKLEQRGFIVGLILAFVIIVLILYAWFQNKKKNQLLSVRNNEIQAQATELEKKQAEIVSQRDAIEYQNKQLQRRNQLINSSIQASLTIQNAILPTGEALEAFFSECAMLYHPKDVVSGDFYWFYQQDNTAFLAIIDCTGHGVPGALMSMIGNDLLNNIIKVKRIEEPGKVLKELDKEVHATLQRSVSKANYGMDVCLVRIEKQASDYREITFAGAKRPLWFMRKQEGKVEVLKEDRKSIGNTEYGVDFKSKTLTLTAGDTLYLATDGLADQNDQKRRKLGTKQVVSFLEKNAQQCLVDQINQLDTILQRHQRGTQQRDDITLVAVRL